MVQTSEYHLKVVLKMNVKSLNKTSDAQFKEYVTEKTSVTPKNI